MARKTNLTNSGEFQRQSFAQDGFRVVDNTFTQIDGEDYVAIYVLQATTNTVLTTRTGDNLNGVDLQQGMIIYGDIQAVTVGTGVLLAYIK